MTGESGPPTGDGPTLVDRSREDRTGAPVGPDAPLADDPTAPADGLDPGEEGRVPLAPRYHGAVIDPTHPEFFTTAHRLLPDPADPLDQPERRLVVDDHTSRTTGATGITQPLPSASADTPGIRPDAPGDPRRGLPDAEPDST